MALFDLAGVGTFVDESARAATYAAGGQPMPGVAEYDAAVAQFKVARAAQIAALPAPKVVTVAGLPPTTRTTAPASTGGSWSSGIMAAFDGSIFKSLADAVASAFKTKSDTDVAKIQAKSAADVAAANARAAAARGTTTATAGLGALSGLLPVAALVAVGSFVLKAFKGRR